MSIEHPTLAERVSSSFSELTTIAATLNTVSDLLGRSIAEIDESLKKLNLGITVWVPLQQWEGFPENGFEYWSEELGYAKNGSKWGISLKRVEGRRADPDGDRAEVWAFGDGPRALRLIAIDKIPDLIEKLSEQASLATNKIQKKIDDVQQVAAAINPRAQRNVPRRPLTMRVHETLGFDGLAARGVKP